MYETIVLSSSDRPKEACPLAEYLGMYFHKNIDITPINITVKFWRSFVLIISSFNINADMILNKLCEVFFNHIWKGCAAISSISLLKIVICLYSKWNAKPAFSEFKMQIVQLQRSATAVKELLTMYVLSLSEFPNVKKGK